MADVAYREVYAMSRIQARLRLVTTYHETGSIRETARRWHTSRQVVRKWLRRYQAEGLPGLEHRSRRRHKRPIMIASPVVTIRHLDLPENVK